jgi:hypothetical protein
MYSASVVDNATLLASLLTMRQVIFPTIDMCLRWFSFQLCIPHNLSRSIQLAQTLLLWDTTN